MKGRRILLIYKKKVKSQPKEVLTNMHCFTVFSAWIYICVAIRLIFKHISHFLFYFVIKDLCDFYLLGQNFSIS